MLSARIVVPIVAVACIAGAALLFPAATRTAWQRVGSLTGLVSADADAQDAGGSGKAGGSRRGAAGPIPVTVATAEKAPFPLIVRTFGTVQSPAVVVIGARISSQVTSVHVKDGQMVKAGDLLISLDDRVVLAALARDKAVLAKDNALLVSATADLSRAKDLVKKGAGTEQAYDTALAAQQSAQATVESDQATVNADELQLDFTKITAPIDGRLGAVQVSTGDLVGGGTNNASSGTSGSGLVTVTEVDPIQVIFHLPEDNLPVFKAMLDAGKPPAVKAFKSGTDTPHRLGRARFHRLRGRYGVRHDHHARGVRQRQGSALARTICRPGDRPGRHRGCDGYPDGSHPAGPGRSVRLHRQIRQHDRAEADQGGKERWRHVGDKHRPRARRQRRHRGPAAVEARRDRRADPAGNGRGRTERIAEILP